LERVLARRIQESIRADACRAREVVRIGDLTATLSTEDPNPYLNYAIPDEGAAPSDADVRELIAWYGGRGRRPRLEYLAELAPEVEDALVGQGFEVEGRLPLMTCTDAPPAHPAPEGIELVRPRSDDELGGTAFVQWEAYEADGAVPERAVRGLRRTVESGGVVVLARDASTREPAGAGLVTVPQEGFAELTSVGVRANFRRRGIAEAMAAFLAREALASGMACVFLMAKGNAEARIYERAGFSRTSDVLHISVTDYSVFEPAKAVATPRPT
jgi:ribosomal protein S18 acetylase RimI-like enzyme